MNAKEAREIAETHLHGTAIEPYLEMKRLRDALAQGIDSLQSFVDDSRDPGTGALSALYIMRAALGFHAKKPVQAENDQAHSQKGRERGSDNTQD